MKNTDNTKPIASFKINNLKDLTIKDFSDLTIWLSSVLRDVNQLHVSKGDYSNNPSWKLYPNKKVLVKVFRASGRKYEKLIAKLAVKNLSK